VGCRAVGAWGVLGGAGGRAGHVARLGRATRRPRPPAGATLAPTGRPAAQPRPGLATATCAGPTTPAMNEAARPRHDHVRAPWRALRAVQRMGAGCLPPAARTAGERGGATVARRCQTPLAHHPACAGHVRGVSDTCSEDRPRIWRRDWGTTVSDTPGAPSGLCTPCGRGG